MQLYFLLILALTGLTWSFGWYRDAFYTAFGISTTSKQTHAPTSAVPPKTAGERGSKKHPKTDYTQWAEVLADLQSRYPEYKSISIQDGSATVSTATYGNTRGSDRYSFDPATGKITEIQLYKDLPKSAKIRGWIYSVHAGNMGRIDNPDIKLSGFTLRGCLCHNRFTISGSRRNSGSPNKGKQKQACFACRKA